MATTNAERLLSIYHAEALKDQADKNGSTRTFRDKTIVIKPHSRTYEQSFRRAQLVHQIAHLKMFHFKPEEYKHLVDELKELNNL